MITSLMALLITSLIALLIAALVLLIIYFVVGLFIKESRIMTIIGIILGLILLLYGLHIFKVTLP